MSEHEETVSATNREQRQPTVKPKKVLDVLRKLNVMFVGSNQHDAHELLRCIVSYIEDAAQEVRRRWPADVTCGLYKAVYKKKECNKWADQYFSLRSAKVAATSFEVPQATVRDVSGTCLSPAGTDVCSSQQVHDRSSACHMALKSLSVSLTRLTAENGGSKLTASSNTSKVCPRVCKRMNPFVLLQRCDDSGRPRSTKRKLLLHQRCEMGPNNNFRAQKEGGDLQAAAGLANSTDAMQQNVLAFGESESQDMGCCCENSQQTGRCSRLQRLYEDANRSYRLFRGESVIKKRCLECDTVFSHSETFDEIMIPVCKSPRLSCDDRGSLNDDEMDCQGKQRKDDSLFSRAFRGKERLDGENKYSCSNCCRYTQADIWTEYLSMPPVITVHLKRFGVAAPRNGGRVVKVNDHLSTPHVLPCFVCPAGCDNVDHQYHLYAIVMHSGSSVDSGHYKSYVRIVPCTGYRVVDVKAQGLQFGAPNNRSSSSVSHASGSGATVSEGPAQLSSMEHSTFTWIECNDEFVRPCTASDISRQLQRCSLSNRLTPYLLFYSKGAAGRLPSLQ